MEPVEIPFPLPHELVANVITTENVNVFTSLDDPFLEKLRGDTCRTLGLNSKETLAIGLHGDGVPHQQGQSVEAISWNILGSGGPERYLFGTIEKKYLARSSGRHTTDCMMRIFCMVYGPTLQRQLSTRTSRW